MARVEHATMTPASVTKSCVRCGCFAVSPCKVCATPLETPPASDTAEAAPACAYLTSSTQHRIKEYDTASVVSDAGGVSRATLVAQTLHGDTAKHPHRIQVTDAGVIVTCLTRAIKACDTGMCIQEWSYTGTYTQEWNHTSTYIQEWSHTGTYTQEWSLAGIHDESDVKCLRAWIIDEHTCTHRRQKHTGGS